GETPNETLLKAMTAAAPPLSSVAPSASAKVAAIVDKALAIAPGQRFPAGRAMRAAVRAGRATMAPAARPRNRDCILATGATQARSMTTPVTKASVPIVRDIGTGGPRAGKMLLAALMIGFIAFGAALLVRGKSRGGNAAAGATSAASAIPSAAQVLEDA